MKKTLVLFISLTLSAFSYAKNVTYDLAESGINICDTGSGQLLGNVYRCITGGITLEKGDSVIYTGESNGAPITLEAVSGNIILEGKNNVGTQQQRINLKTSSSPSRLQVMKRGGFSKGNNKNSSGYRDIVISNKSTVWGDIHAHNDVTLRHSVIQGNITSDGGDVTTGDDETKSSTHNKIFGNVTALHAIYIKQTLVCGTLESKGRTVTVENSKSNGQGSGNGNSNGVFALHDAIKSHGQPILKQADICGSINPTPSSVRRVTFIVE